MKYGIYIFAFKFIFLLLVIRADAEFTIRSRHIQGINYLHLEDITKYLGFSIQLNEKNIHLSNKYNQFILSVGGRKAYLNSILFQLSFAPKLNRTSYFVSEQDFMLLIDPLMRNQALPDHRMNRIILDPGHGGEDDGAVGTKYMEKDLNLILAKNLKSLLVSTGYEVLLTRDNDRFVSLTDRGQIASNWKADLFVSIHCNAAPNKGVTGIETYVVTPKGSPSNSKTVLQNQAVPGNSFDTLNARLAYEMQKNLIRYSAASDRGVKYYRWQVLREARCPAVLVETGFLSNIGEERKLASNTYQKKLVQGMARGLTEFHKALTSKKH